MRAFVSFIIVSMFLANCGGDKGSNYSPLNSEQKQNYNSTLESMGRSFKAAQSAKSMRGAIDPMQHKMADRIVKKNCKIKFDTNGLSNSSNSTSGNVDFSMDVAIYGDGCPVEMTYLVGLKSKAQTKNHIEASFMATGNYTVRDEEYKQWNDIYGMSFSGSGTINSDYDPSKNTAKQVSDVSVRGELQSSKNGKGSFEISNRGEARVEDGKGQGEIVQIFLIRFPSYNAELKKVQNFEGAKSETQIKTSYYLNGELITAVEFNNYISKAAGGKTHLSVFSAFNQR